MKDAKATTTGRGKYAEYGHMQTNGYPILPKSQWPRRVEPPTPPAR